MAESVLKEATRIRDQLKEFKDAGKLDSNSDIVLNELDTLNDLDITKEILTSTKIAPLISILANKSTNKEVQQKAKALFNNWMNVMKGAAVAKPAQSSSSSVPNEKRQKIRKMFYDEFMKGEQFASASTIGKIAERTAMEVEEAIPKDDYDHQYRLLLQSLRDQGKNAALRLSERLLKGELKPNEFARFSIDDLITPEQREQKEREKQEAFNQKQVPQPKACVSELFQCGRCHSKNCTFYQQQTRSADEPMTNFVKCNDCGKEWRE